MYVFILFYVHLHALYSHPSTVSAIGSSEYRGSVSSFRGKNCYLLQYACSTGSAGLIQTIQLFAGGHIVGGVLATIATAGWTVQGLGNAFYYRQVSLSALSSYIRMFSSSVLSDLEPPRHRRPLFHQGKRAGVDSTRALV